MMTSPDPWGDLLRKMSQLIDDMVLPRATELRCGPGVSDWLKSTIPTAGASVSPLGAPLYPGVRMVETDDLPEGCWAMMDQYGCPMLEGEAPARA